MGLRPRSIRARGTLVATVVAAVLLTALAAVSDWALRTVVYSEARHYADVTADRVAGGVRAHGVQPLIEPGSRISLIQVIDAQGKVVGATAAATKLPPLTKVRPPPGVREMEFDRCYFDMGCYTLRVERVTQAADSPVVVAASPLPRLLVSGLGAAVHWAISILSIALIAWLSWLVIGRSLRPVERLREQYDEIRASRDPSLRIPEPQGDDEISRLIRSVNGALEEMERTLARQRQFASDASHELRTPIAGLRANLEDALLHPDDTDFREVAEASLRATDRLETIIADLLLLARIGAGTESLENIDLSALLRGEAQPDVRLEIEPGLWVHGVRSQLARVITNLLDNAHRYGAGEIRLTAWSLDGESVITVSDEGPGIPEADRERIFGSFTRLDTARSRGAGGTGLGLAIAREVAVAHGGSLGVEDTQRGARFVLRLPLSSGEENGGGGPQEPTAIR